MKKLWTQLICLFAVCFTANVQGLEYQLLFENAYVSIANVSILPQEELESQHNDSPYVYASVLGGVLTRIEADNTETTITLEPTVALFLPADQPGDIYSLANNTDAEILFTIIVVKQ